MSAREKFKKDYERYYGEEVKLFKVMLRLFTSRNLRFMFWLRLSPKMHILGKIILNYYKNRYGLELPSTIGGGLVLSHPYCITINGGVKVGDNCTIFKGVTIGSVRSGKLNGVPIIGDNVVLCSNCTVCGGIKIGSDVLIAANSFVDFDVPDHSVVIGNPGTIHHKIGASKDY